MIHRVTPHANANEPSGPPWEPIGVMLAEIEETWFWSHLSREIDFDCRNLLEEESNVV